MDIEISCPSCPVETCLMFINNKWKFLIIYHLLKGEKRFNQLHKDIDSISQKVLTVNLRELEENGFLERNIYPEVPPRVEYSLTDLGRSLKPTLKALKKWGLTYQSSLNY